MQMPGPSSDRRPGRPRGLVPVLLVLLLAAGACVSGRGGQEERQSGGSSAFADRPLRVRVENQNWNTIHVYILAGGQSRSLGQLSSQNTEEYEVPSQIMGSRREIRLVADPIGSREGFVTDRILVNPGDRVRWTLAQPLVHSHILVD